MTKHIHAENMLLYAQDAMETDTPWERWESIDPRAGWRDLEDHPRWLSYVEYRRKRKTIEVNGHIVTAPETAIPPKYREYFFPDFSDCNLVVSYTWVNDGTDRNILDNNMLFLTEMDAIAFARALLDYNKGDK